MKGVGRTTFIFYLIAIAVCAFSVYELNLIYNPPQPYVYMNYNTVAQGGIGFVLNTLPFTIHINNIYCQAPNGTRDIFGDPNNNTLQRGSNTPIEIGVNQPGVQRIAPGCSTWKVSYLKVSSLSANTASQTSNLLVAVT